LNNQERIKGKLSDYYSNLFEDKLLEDIASVGYLDTVKKGELLIDIGDDMTHIPLILNGIVKIIRMDERGDEFVLYYLEKGDTCAISFANCLNRKKSIFKGVVEKDVEAIFLPVGYIDDWLKNYKSWRSFIIDSYHFRLVEMVESIDSLAFMKLEERMHKYLIDKVKITKENTLDITHQEIATDLNSSRVVVSRLLKRLESEKKIIMQRNKLIINND
jgi:CRP/FNR family transcriptional regulator, anaerobic regulatory protein